MLTKKIILENILGKDYTKKKIMIFGASKLGIETYRVLKKDINVNYFCDNDSSKQGEDIDGIEIISLDTLLDIGIEELIVIVASSYRDEISQQLEEKGIKRIINFDTSSITILKNFKKIKQVHLMLEDEVSRDTYLSVIVYRITKDKSKLIISSYEQYFHKEVMAIAGNVIVDGGAYDGNTAIPWVEKLDKDCLIYSFEPFPDSFKLLEENIKKEK